MGRTADYSQQRCAIAATLEVVGDPWTLLILRDAFNGARRFEQWQEGLGVARNVLAARLKSLVAHGVLETRLYSERPPRREYLLTPKGRELSPVLMVMADWGDRHIYGGGPHPWNFTHKDHAFRPRLVCADCGEAPGRGEIQRVGQDLTAPTVGEALARLEEAKLAG